MVQPLSSGSNNIYPTNETNGINNSNEAKDSDGVKVQIAVKMFKAMQETQKIAGNIIQDTAEISNEAFQKLAQHQNKI